MRNIFLFAILRLGGMLAENNRNSAATHGRGSLFELLLQVYLRQRQTVRAQP